ncbi:hypothetical protein [Enhygromyxa salina]|uniref:Peptidase S8/S53 domain-containing protein n=1 Tax=Enhygromyxa salina TaxID=215803 RepID=A0A2S9XQP7_9BACT|nr:hypothetical protein [Enhygromyxa salina]PRP95189.1 hypothetical protein ENSA7_75030 [Enhygromyxa salina]
MNKNIYCVIVGALLLGGCGEFENQDDDALPEVPQTPSAVGDVQTASPAQPHALSTGLDFECVQLGAPIIGIVTNDPLDCAFATMPETWKATPLFTEGSPWLDQATMPLPGASPLRNFCRYDYLGNEAYEDAYEDFMDAVHYAPPGDIDGGTFATDCPSVIPNGLYGSAVIDGLHDAYMLNVGAVTAGDLNGISLSPTILTFLDTAHDGHQATHEHADLLRNLAFDLSCPDDRAGCKEQLQRVLVTPRSKPEYSKTNWYEGGDIGYMHELGMGVAEAVLNWRELNDDGDPDTHTPMVINVSVAADLQNAYATNIAFAPTLAALEAAKMAYCYGNLMIGAAGNGHDRCTNQSGGLLLPAAFEQITPPTQAECLAMGYEPDWNTNMYPVYGPIAAARLIHAVGGRDEHDEQIPNQRHDSGTKAQAPASGAVSSVDSTPLTGTSVAAAAYSAAAHLVWSANPGLRPDEVIGLLYSSGYSLGEPAVAGGFVGVDMRRLAICPALAASPAGSALECVARATNTDGNLGSFIAATQAAVVAASGSATLWTAMLQDSALPQLCIGALPTPFLIPQPERPKCSVCSIEVPDDEVADNDTLYMSIAHEPWAVDLQVTEAYLHVYDSNRNKSTVTLDVVTEINTAESTDIIEVPLDVPDTTSAELEFVYDDESSHSNPLTVWQPTG